MYDVKEGRLRLYSDLVEYFESPNLDDVVISPQFVVIHNTLTNNARSAREWVLNERSNCSYHLIIDRDGSVEQFAPLTVATKHSAPSRYQNILDLNKHSISMAFVNMGWFRKSGSALLDSECKKYTTGSLGGVIEAPHELLGSSGVFWQCYTHEQIKTGLEVLNALVQAFDIREVLTHEQIDERKTKTDPGPIFPLQLYRAALDRKFQ